MVPKQKGSVAEDRAALFAVQQTESHGSISQEKLFNMDEI